MVFGIPPLLSRVLLLGPLIAALVVLTAVLGVAARKKSPVRRAGRRHFVLVNAAGAALVWWMWYWNLL
jgi:hypothetical protein